MVGFGFDVFDRRGRRVVLNPAGQALLRSLQAALVQLEDGVQAAALTARTVVTTIINKNFFLISSLPCRASFATPRRPCGRSAIGDRDRA